MRKSPQGSFLVDRLHKGFVLTCLAVTIYGCTVLGMRGYNYFTEVKPQLKQKELLQKQSLLAEGSSENLPEGPQIRA